MHFAGDHILLDPQLLTMCNGSSYVAKKVLIYKGGDDRESMCFNNLKVELKNADLSICLLIDIDFRGGQMYVQTYGNSRKNCMDQIEGFYVPWLRHGDWPNDPKYCHFIEYDLAGKTIYNIAKKTGLPI